MWLYNNFDLKNVCKEIVFICFTAKIVNCFHNEKKKKDGQIGQTTQVLSRKHTSGL